MTDRRTITVERKGERRPFKPKAWTHMDELKTLIGKRVVIVGHNAEDTRGTLVAADQFTLLLSTPHTSNLIVFKGAIAALCAE